MNLFTKGRGRILTTLVAMLFMVATLSVAAFAQTETGQITGRVTDPNGAAVPGATVTAKNVGTSAERTATTDADGVYTMTNLQPGIYDVTATGTGFQPGTQRAQVTTGGRLTLDVPLGVAAVGASVTVVAGEGGVEVNTQTQELADVVSGTQIRELPTQTRDPYALVATAGNVTEDNVSGRGTGFSINGQRSASTNILLDGGENVNTFTASVGQSIPLDAVGEFRVITSNFSAEYGRASGGIVNVSTRAGTNDYHGSLYEFNRVSRLASAGFDTNARGLPKPQFTRNQPGYSIGGRIIRDKLFFFNSTEWTRVRSTSSVTRFVPAAALIAASNARTQAVFAGQTLVGTPTGTVFTVGQVCSELGLGGGAFCSLPANTPALQEVSQSLATDVGAGSPQNSYSTTTRIDWNVSDKTQLYGRYAIESQDFFAGTAGNSPYQGFNTGTTNFNQNALLNVTHTFTTNLVSQSKLVYNRLNQLQPLAEQPAQPTFYFRNNVVASFLGRRIALPGYLPFSPGSAIPFGGPQNVGQIYEDMSWTKSKHTFRFGGTFVYIQDNRTFGAFENAVALFGTTTYTTAFNNFVLGNLRRFQVAVDPQGQTTPGAPVNRPVSSPQFSRSNRYREFAGYFNDAWRITPRLTANLGVRYEYYGVQHNKNPNLDSNFYRGQGATEQERIRNGQVFIAEQSPVGGLWAPDKNNFAPRLGLAWDIKGDGRMSLRGGYGIAYERNFGNVTFNVIQNPPAYAVVTVNPGDPGFPTIPVSTNNFGPLAGTGGPVALPGLLNVRHVDEHIRNAYSHFWSVSFENEIFRHTVASVEYSGSAGRNLYDLTNDNRIGSACHYIGASACFTATNPNALLNTKYYPLNTRGNRGYSNYNAMIASLESSNLRNLGLQFTARYTYSVTKDNLSSTFSESSNNFNLGLLDPFNPQLDYGYADFDTRHRFAGSFNWDIGQVWGFNTSSNDVVRHGLGGWTLTGIISARSGQPFTVFDCTNAAFEVCPRLIPASGLPRNVNNNPPATAQPNQFVLIDLSGQPTGNYVDPLTGTSEFGPFPANMTKRNEFRGPGFWNVDFGIYKNIQITENTRIQLRGEMFNAFNHANMFVEGSTADVSQSSFIEGFKSGRRNVQLAVKFLF